MKLLLTLIIALVDVGSIKTLDRGIIDMDTIWGKGPVYISFWATWCTNCVQELDEINKIKDSLGIFVITVNEDGLRKEGRVLSFLKGKKWDYPVVMDEGQKLMRKYGVTALPTSFLYSKDKKLLKRFTGFSSRDAALMKELLRSFEEK